MSSFDISSDDLVSQKDKILIIPISPMEQYGPHLPLTTGIHICNRLANDISKHLSTEKIKLMVAPAFFQLSTGRSKNIKVSFHQEGIIKNHPLSFLLTSYINMGFSKIILLSFNLDLENMSVIRKIIGKLSNDDVKIYELGGAVFYNKFDEIDNLLKNEEIYIEYEVHGDIKETSIMLYINEKLVNDIYKTLEPVRINIKTKKLAGTKTFEKMGAKKGYIGSPSAASIKLGKKLYKIYRKKYVELFTHIIEGKNPPDIPLLLKLSMMG